MTARSERKRTAVPDGAVPVIAYWIDAVSGTATSDEEGIKDAKTIPRWTVGWLEHAGGRGEDARIWMYLDAMPITYECFLALGKGMLVEFEVLARTGVKIKFGEKNWQERVTQRLKKIEAAIAQQQRK